MSVAVVRVLTGVLFLWGTTQAGDAIQSLQSIRGTVESFLQAETADSGYAKAPEITVGHLDERLRLKACERPIEAFLPRGARLVGNVTVGVRCPGEKPWTLYVQAQVRPTAPVVVTRRALSRGVLLGPDDVELEERDLTRLTSGYLTDLEAVLGMKLRRSLGAGMALSETLLKAPVMVRRGERVTILAQGGGLEVSMEGEALSDGAPGEAIRVRNLSSRREIEATVVAPGTVEVRM